MINEAFLSQHREAVVIDQSPAGIFSRSKVDAGNPFTPAAKSIVSEGKVSDGPVGTMATGYSIIKADSLDAAIEMSKGCPHLQSVDQITVYETFPVM